MPEAPPEPRFGATPLLTELDEPRRLALASATVQPPEPSQLRGRTLSVGLAASLAFHLSPLLLLLSWSSTPADSVAAIPIELVLEQPPPEPKPEPNPEKPPPGRLASIDMGEPAKEPQPAAAAPDHATEESTETQVAAIPPPPDLVSALPKPVSPPEPVTTVPPMPERAAPTKPVVKPVLATPHPPKPHPARPLQVPGPAATRDEYLAYITSLINRNSHLLAPMVAGRSGVAVISILVLGDGTIARIAVKRSSGHPDIDVRIEQMIAAVRRFPPLPQWIQGPSVLLDYHRIFPDRMGEH